MLLLCTKKVTFTFNEQTYIQVEGVMMGSPLGPLFANIFMCELENYLIPKLGDKISNWSRYVDDTFAFIKPQYIQHVREELNSFHKSVQFTYEVEVDNKIAFLDVLLNRTSDQLIETSVFRKSTNTDLYMNWHSHAPLSWKIATLRSLIQRAVLISSTNESLNQELKHLTKVFIQINNYPSGMVKSIIGKEKRKTKETKTLPVEELNTTEDEELVNLNLNLPYAGEKGEKIVTNLIKCINKKVNKDRRRISISTVYNSMKLSSKFILKDKTKFEHMHNVVYHARCPNKKCNSHYGGQTKCRIEKRAIQHRSTDRNSHLFKHAEVTKHKRVNLHDFKILGKGYASDFKRKISESLFIKQLSPDLNIQKDSYKLSLFN